MRTFDESDVQHILAVRAPCSRPGCGDVSVVDCRFYSGTGPVYLGFCKTHIQHISVIVDGLVQRAIFDDPSL